MTPRPEQPRSHAAEDSQIDLLTLAGALMLTVMCLLLSQILTDNTRGAMAPEEESIPQVHRLRLTLRIPWWDGARDIKYPGGDGPLHVVVARKAWFGPAGQVLPFAVGSQEGRGPGCEFTVKMSSKDGLGWLETEARMTPESDDASVFEFWFHLESAVLREKLPQRLLNAWHELARQCDAKEERFAAALPGIVVDSPMHGHLEYRAAGEKEEKFPLLTFALTSRLAPPYNAGICHFLTESDARKSLEAREKERATLVKEYLDGLDKGGIASLVAEANTKETRLRFHSLDLLTGAEPPFSFTYRLVIRSSAPVDEDEPSRRKWRAYILPTAKTPPWPKLP